MEKIQAHETFNVLNENPVVITAKTNLLEYVFEVGSPENPTMQTLQFSEIKYLFSNGKGIQNGYLTFEKKDEEKIYNELGFKEWKDILKVKDVEDILLKPTVAKLQQIIDINNIALFERIRMTLVGMNSTGTFDISNRVVQVIEARYDELMRGIRNSKIIIQKQDTEKEISEDVDTLKSELAEMKKLLEKALKSQDLKLNPPQKSEKEEVKDSGEPKKTTRSSKKSDTSK